MGYGEVTVTEEVTASVLTKRQRDVVILVAQGLTNKQIADKLCLAEKTVKAHRSNIYHVLKIRGAARLTVYAHQQGWITYEVEIVREGHAQ